MRPFPEKTGSLSVPESVATGTPKRVLNALRLWYLGVVLTVKLAVEL
jgi:hypothetical protein